MHEESKASTYDLCPYTKNCFKVKRRKIYFKIIHSHYIHKFKTTLSNLSYLELMKLGDVNHMRKKLV